MEKVVDIAAEHSETCFVGVIPARSGSKGIPGKNFAPLCGKSLLERAIEGAVGSGVLDRIIVSSDSQRAKDIASANGVAFHHRSASASLDNSTASDVILNLADSKTFLTCDTTRIIIVYLQPTSPLRTAADIRHAVALAKESPKSTCVSVCSKHVTLEKLVTVGAHGLLESVHGPDFVVNNRQLLTECFLPNGAIYVFPLNIVLGTGAIPIDGAVAHFMTPESSLDVDTKADWDRAEIALGCRHAN